MLYIHELNGPRILLFKLYRNLYFYVNKQNLYNYFVSHYKHGKQRGFNQLTGAFPGTDRWNAQGYRDSSELVKSTT